MQVSGVSQFCVNDGVEHDLEPAGPFTIFTLNYIIFVQQKNLTSLPVYSGVVLPQSEISDPTPSLCSLFNVQRSDSVEETNHKLLQNCVLLV